MTDQQPTEPPPSRTVLVRTTIPILPPSAMRKEILTPRLLLRPMAPSDLAALHVLRTQEEVMAWTRLGRIDASLEETQAKLDTFLPPHDTITHNFAICLRSTGELIGKGGVHMLCDDLGWPELGYMFKKETWRQGYASEFARAFVQAWSELERQEVEVLVDARTVTMGEDGRAEECLMAYTAGTNVGSQGVLLKAGFEKLFTFVGSVNPTKDPHMGDAITLPVFRFLPGRLAKKKI